MKPNFVPTANRCVAPIQCFRCMWRREFTSPVISMIRPIAKSPCGNRDRNMWAGVGLLRSKELRPSPNSSWLGCSSVLELAPLLPRALPQAILPRAIPATTFGNRSKLGTESKNRCHPQRSRCYMSPPLVRWCKGSTGLFDSSSHGSNPCRTATNDDERSPERLRAPMRAPKLREPHLQSPQPHTAQG